MTELDEIRRFYTETIPEQFNRAFEAESTKSQDTRIDEMRAVNASLRIRMAGDETAGGPPQVFTLEIDGGRMRPVEESKHPLLFTLEHDAQALGVLRRESGGSILDFLAGMSGVGGELRLTRGRVARLRDIEGTIRVERSGEAPFHLHLHFRREPQSEIDCSLAMDDATHAALRSGELDAQDAFLTEQVRVEGDMQMAMQLAMAFIGED